MFLKGEIKMLETLVKVAVYATYASFKYIDKHASDDIPGSSMLYGTINHNRQSYIKRNLRVSFFLVSFLIDTIY